MEPKYLVDLGNSVPCAFFPQEFASFDVPNVVMNFYSFNICAYNYTYVILYSYTSKSPLARWSIG